MYRKNSLHDYDSIRLRVVLVEGVPVIVGMWQWFYDDRSVICARLRWDNCGPGAWCQ